MLKALMESLMVPRRQNMETQLPEYSSSSAVRVASGPALSHHLASSGSAGGESAGWGPPPRARPVKGIGGGSTGGEPAKPSPTSSTLMPTHSFHGPGGTHHPPGRTGTYPGAAGGSASV